MMYSGWTYLEGCFLLLFAKGLQEAIWEQTRMKESAAVTIVLPRRMATKKKLIAWTHLESMFRQNTELTTHVWAHI